MALTGPLKRVRDKVQVLWLRTVDLIPKMRSTADIRPFDFEGVFRFGTDPDSKAPLVETSRIVLKVPQDADSRHRGVIFVAVEGWMKFDTENVGPSAPIRTTEFGTHAAYFLNRGGILEHVYGAHYDFSSEIGHPTFHAQLKSFYGHWETVNEHFTLESEPGEDRVEKVLRNVRLPSAQMDVFSSILQVCADHLISATSGSDALDAFRTLARTNAQCIQGAGYRVPGLSAEAARRCYRAHHWYPNGG